MHSIHVEDYDGNIHDDYHESESDITIKWESDQGCRLSISREKLSKIIKLDWREHGVVSPVVNQGGCRSCFIFAAIATMESAYMINVDRKHLYKFSEQYFTDCIQTACDGGIMKMVWSKTMTDGLRKEINYKQYIAKETACQPEISKPVPNSFLGGYCQTFDLSSDEQLQAILYSYGPVAVAIDSSNPTFAFLKGGPWLGKCTNRVNHAVTLVGWNEKYWIVKNSWGQDWGLLGYLYLPKKQQSICGIYNQAGVPYFG